ncbi:hypothetical protein CXG81DRAFT_20738 [Caulochytrium protostelioides]|uniref:PHD-type domain-containing protein n=1 Tax=Caulochytrium protostelioides TaxID=1555241 RepID=A0A4P9X012_9FUNG|nr:hypothetical protein CAUPRSCDRAFT_11358 [Caulochytrium protostelioides]RKO99144.1 hypothetical protein CXG81DRAFT_20738 [Caulochytrium protostelioides]|eukprot:RKO99144.1 hypothetical protein CXG81DRAFT_20738 [Caulochytrium protostelioides]
MVAIDLPTASGALPTSVCVLCGAPFGDALLVGCDGCTAWAHTDCAHTARADIDAVAQWFCPSCHPDRTASILWHPRCHVCARVVLRDHEGAIVSASRPDGILAAGNTTPPYAETGHQADGGPSMAWCSAACLNEDATQHVDTAIGLLSASSRLSSQDIRMSSPAGSVVVPRAPSPAAGNADEREALVLSIHADLLQMGIRFLEAKERLIRHLIGLKHPSHSDAEKAGRGHKNPVVASTGRCGFDGRIQQMDPDRFVRRIYQVQHHGCLTVREYAVLVHRKYGDGYRTIRDSACRVALSPFNPTTFFRNGLATAETEAMPPTEGGPPHQDRHPPPSTDGQRAVAEPAWRVPLPCMTENVKCPKHHAWEHIKGVEVATEKIAWVSAYHDIHKQSCSVSIKPGV